MPFLATRVCRCQNVFGVFLYTFAFICFGASLFPAEPQKSTSQATESAAYSERELWKSGEDGYHTYRIPSLITTKQGTLLAFCEGRKDGRGDSGEIHILWRRSIDGGKTWSAQRILWQDGGNTCGNPCPVVDQVTGKIWLLMTHNHGNYIKRESEKNKATGTRTVWVSHSDDDGQTWTKPADVTATAKISKWTWYATGPGVGIQLRLGANKGRMVIPCDHNDPGEVKSRSHIIYSDDHGKTWLLGGRVESLPGNECQVIELIDGRIMLNMRNCRPKSKSGTDRFYRNVAFSSDGGMSWTKGQPDLLLPEPICQASIIRYRSAVEKDEPWILFSNPADYEKRKNLTVRLSKDDGKNWHFSKVLCKNPSAYSCLAILPNNSIGCLFEVDNSLIIIFSTFALDWILNDTQNAKVSSDLQWKQLPRLPDREGFAGMFAGVSGDALIVAGGAHFPEKPPWDGGTKVWSDKIYILDQPDGAWRIADEKLPRPLGYGISATYKGKVICAGGGSGEKHFSDVFALQLRKGRIEIEELAQLPKPCANAGGGIIGTHLYLAGGTEKPNSTSAMHNFWSLDLSQSDAKNRWKELKPWPGPERLQPVVAVQDNSLYIISGLRLKADDNGKSHRMTPFLTDAYRYSPSEEEKNSRWQQIADVPRAVAAAPSPAMAIDKSRLAIFGGIDHLVDSLPQPTHPGFSYDVFVYDAIANIWMLHKQMPASSSRVTAPSVMWKGKYIVVSGERAPGRRSPQIFSVEQKQE